MLRSGVNSSSAPTPNRAAVAGISCIRPRAPLRDSARRLKADSTRITAATTLGLSWNLRAATSTSAP